MTDSDERDALLSTLAYQRASVVSIVQDLSEEDWHTSVVPSGWTIAGFVEHIAGAERWWFHRVVANGPAQLPWDDGRPEYDPDAPFTCDRPSAEILEHYRDVCRRSDEILETVSMSDAPKGLSDDFDLPVETSTDRWIVLHMIEETAAHTGHLEIARELLDGRTKLGLR